MGFLSDLIDKGRDFLSATPPKPVATSVVKRDRFDEVRFRETREDIPAINRLVLDLDRNHDFAEPFVQDIHDVLYKTMPEIRDVGEMDPRAIGNHTMVTELSTIPQVQALRANTRGDKYTTAMGLISMTPTLKEAMTQAKKQTEELAQRQAEAEQAAQEAAQALQDQLASLAMCPELPPEMQSPGTEALQQAIDAAQQAQQQAQQAQQATQAGAEQAATGMRQAIKTAAEKADKEAEEEAGLCAAYGQEDGELQKMSVPERMKLMESLRNNRLSEFYKLLGQFRMVQQAESRKRVIHAATEIHGVKLSNDLTRLTTESQIRLAIPEMEMLFWNDFANDALLTHDVRGKERQGQGPVICVVDESGSMSSTDVAGGSREAWSKALSLAMADQAKQKGRDFYYIGFSSSRQQWTVKFEKGKAALADILTMTEHFYAGGTSYEPPLLQALKIVEEAHADDKPKPDIVFMTDDDYGSLSESFMTEWNRVKDLTSLKCFGIAIGCSTSGALASVSDNVRAIGELTSDPRVMADVFRTV